VELRRERIKKENNDEEVEGVQRPAEKSRGYGMELRSAAVRCGTHCGFAATVCADSDVVSTHSRHRMQLESGNKMARKEEPRVQ
jgi:hypothetical protein